MRGHFKYLCFTNFPIWCLFTFPTKVLNIHNSCTNAIPKVGVHLGVIKLHPLHFTLSRKPNVRVVTCINNDIYMFIFINILIQHSNPTKVCTYTFNELHNSKSLNSMSCHIVDN